MIMIRAPSIIFYFDGVISPSILEIGILYIMTRTRKTQKNYVPQQGSNKLSSLLIVFKKGIGNKENNCYSLTNQTRILSRHEIYPPFLNSISVYRLIKIIFHDYSSLSSSFCNVFLSIFIQYNSNSSTRITCKGRMAAHV
jgi:hypothetical protein